MFAIIETGGKQLMVEKEQEIFIEKIIGDENEIIEFDKVLMIDDNIGQPFLEKAKVLGQIIKHGKQKKIVVFKYKPKKNSKTKYGHRQPYTKVKIMDILLDGVKKAIVKDDKIVEVKQEHNNDGSSTSTKATA